MGGFVACMGLPFVAFAFTEDTSSTEPSRVPDRGAPLLESGTLGYLAFGLFLAGSVVLFLWERKREDGRAPWVPLAAIAALVCVGVILIQLGSITPFPSRDALLLMGAGFLESLTFWLRQAGESVSRSSPE